MNMKYKITNQFGVEFKHFECNSKLIGIHLYYSETCRAFDDGHKCPTYISKKQHDGQLSPQCRKVNAHTHTLYTLTLL